MENLNERSHIPENLQEVSIIRSSERIPRKCISYSSSLTTSTSSAVSKRQQTSKSAPKQITKSSAVSKRKALNQIVKQKAKTVRVNRRGNFSSLSEAAVDAEEEEIVISSSENFSSSIVDGTGKDRAETEAEAEVEAGQEAMDLASFRDSLSEAAVDAEEKKGVSSSKKCSSIVDGTGKEQAEAETEAEAEVEVGQMSRVDKVSVLKPPPSVSDRDDAHLCLILDSFTTQLLDWDLNDEDLLLFGQRMLSFVEDNIDVNSFREFLLSFLLEDDSNSRTQLVSTTSSLPNAPPVDEE